jgi:hypothetical protein
LIAIVKQSSSNHFPTIIEIIAIMSSQEELSVLSQNTENSDESYDSEREKRAAAAATTNRVVKDLALQPPPEKVSLSALDDLARDTQWTKRAFGFQAKLEAKTEEL